MPAAELSKKGPPVLGFLAFTSGAFEGAIIRDMRLANALHRRGFKVVIYWMMERNPKLVDPGISQRWLCYGARYHFKRPSNWAERLGKLCLVFPAYRRLRFTQQHPNYVNRLMSNCARAIVDGDEGLTSRLAKFIEQDGVTHLLPTFAMICPFAQAAKSAMSNGTPAPFDYLVTFQGEEIFANYADRIGRLEDYHQRLRDTVAASDWPAVAVSNDYISRLRDEMGIDSEKLRSIYPGVEPATDTGPVDRAAEFAKLRAIFPSLKPDLPIVTYLGRQDSEKGIDLLLYAAKMLRERGIGLQLLCVGGSSFGQHYRQTLEEIAFHLRLGVFWKRRVSDEVRTALFRLSRCIVYPSIHREPFGMVAAEAMCQGTPVIVPDQGGITEVVEVNGKRGGLRFKSWDSGDLAEQMARLITDDALHAELSGNAKDVAASFSVDRMTDRVLELMGLSERQDIQCGLNNSAR